MKQNRQKYSFCSSEEKIINSLPILSFAPTLPVFKQFQSMVSIQNKFVFDVIFYYTSNNMEPTDGINTDSFGNASRLFEEFEDDNSRKSKSSSIDQNGQSETDVAQQRTFRQSLSCDSLKLHKPQNTNLKVYKGKKKQIQTASNNGLKLFTTPKDSSIIFDPTSTNQIVDKNQAYILPATENTDSLCSDVEMETIETLITEQPSKLNKLTPLQNISNESDLSLSLPHKIDNTCSLNDDTANADHAVSAAVVTPNLSREVKQLQRSVKESKILTEFMNEGIDTKSRQKRTKPSDEDECAVKEHCKNIHRSKSVCLDRDKISSDIDRRRKSQGDVISAKHRRCRTRSRSRSSKKRSISRSSKMRSHENIYKMNSDSDDEARKIVSKKKNKLAPSLPVVSSLPVMCCLFLFTSTQ